MDTNSPDMPQTLMEAVAFFPQGNNAQEFMVALSWPQGVKCPRCQSEKVCAIPTRKTWECKCCTEKKQFSVKTGTIFEESPLPLTKWLPAIWLIANAKNGISSYGHVPRGHVRNPDKCDAALGRCDLSGDRRRRVSAPTHFFTGFRARDANRTAVKPYGVR